MKLSDIQEAIAKAHKMRIPPDDEGYYLACISEADWKELRAEVAPLTIPSTDKWEPERYTWGPNSGGLAGEWIEVARISRARILVRDNGPTD